MYLSKLTLNLRNRQVRSEITSPYEMHRTISKAFASNDSATDNRMLFRIESNPKNNISSGINVLVQSSDTEPDWSKLTVDENYFLAEPLTKYVDLSKLASGLYKFKLIANPTIKRNGKRFGLYKEEEQIEWFKRKGEHHGFEPIYLHCSDFTIGNKSKTANMKEDVNKSDIYHLGVSYEGVLKVTNPEEVIKAMLAGIGSAKAFGFGLLTIAIVT